MITETLVICIVLCIGFIVNMQIKIENLEATNRNCHQHITFLGSMIKDMEKKMKESENSNGNS